MNQIERELLHIIQNDFPLERRPFATIARRVGITEEECISLLRHLAETGILREIRPIIAWQKAGFDGVLIGIEADPDKADAVAGAISALPGVTHNYLREGKRNVWCTLIADGIGHRDQQVAFMRSLDGVRHVGVFASEKTYKIGLKLDV